MISAKVSCFCGIIDMSPFGAWFMVSEQLHYITSREDIFYFNNKKYRIYAALGVSQTPNISK